MEFRTWEVGFYYKIKIDIQDGTQLFAREFYHQNERHYSFHWQDARGSLLIRWDDAPHHRHHFRIPYHKHLGERITESLPISLAQVLDEIAQNVLKK